MTDEVWVLGATGRSGRAVAARLHAARVPLVLAGRSADRLAQLSTALGGRSRVVTGALDAQLATLAAEAPAVVLNTVGPFVATGLRVARACPPGTHYVDLANELEAVDDILRLGQRAAAAGQVLVTGAGYGVLGTESVVLRLCADRPRPASVRVDALPALAVEEGRVGAALAGSIVAVLEHGGREVRLGHLVRSPTGSHPRDLLTPDGDRLSTGSGANGELLAAWRASDADSVVAASTAAPSNPALRHLVLPALSLLVRVPGVTGALRAVVARVRLRGAPMSRTASWAHAEVTWADGTAEEGWLRAGDASAFTADAMAEVALRLLRGEGRPGAYTPGALFGPGLAEAAGGTFVAPA